jgi:hypothetical protein
MTAERMPPNKCDLVALQPTGAPVEQTGPAPSRIKRIVDYWPVAGTIVGVIATLAWVMWLLRFAVALIF